MSCVALAGKIAALDIDFLGPIAEEGKCYTVRAGTNGVRTCRMQESITRS
jgi:hypothetical protein